MVCNAIMVPASVPVRVLESIIILMAVFGPKQISGSTDIPRDTPTCKVILAGTGVQELTHCCGQPSNSTCDLSLALENLKNGTLINITANVELSSAIKSENLRFLTITGHNQPTVKCNDGLIAFSSCHNCIIEGITWVGCGIASKHSQPAILFHNSSNITIQNCSFLHSKGQAVVLSEVWGDVSFNHCEFVNNTDYRDHGVAIHYSSTPLGISKFMLIVSNCNFSHNGKRTSRSIVHIGKSSLCNTIIIRDSSFNNNFGSPISVTAQNLHIDGLVVLRKNVATSGGGIFVVNSNTIFGKTSRVSFLRNVAAGKHGGAIVALDNSKIQFQQTSEVTFNGNRARSGAGAIYVANNSTILFDDNSYVVFVKNSVTNNGGAIYCTYFSLIAFKGASIVSFSSNVAKIGGAVFSDTNSTVIFKGNTNVTFVRNRGKENGGALVLHDDSSVVFRDNSTVIFTSNQATDAGAAIRSNGNCNITFTENSNVTFDNNEGYSGGTVQSQNHGNLVFEGNTRVTFDNNTASNGGSLYLHTESDVIFKGHSYITFYNNTAGTNGGAMYSYGNSHITVIEFTNINFIHNVAKTGGAIHATTCDLTISGTANLTFNNNEAVHQGGAVYLSDRTHLLFDKNVDITLTGNSADYGAGVYNDLAKNTTIVFNAKELSHYNNTARVAGNLMYVHIPPSCDDKCLEERIVIPSGSDLDVANFVATPPKQVVLYEPAVPACKDNSSRREGCNAYYVKNVMLGQEILINTCLMDYYNEPTADVAQFTVTSNTRNFTPSAEYFLVSCSLPLKINITGIKSSWINYTMTLSTFKLGVEDRIPMSLNVTVIISPCHPGFQYNPQSQKCECFDHNVVFCSGSNSLIQRGYWFGEVDGMATAATCPKSYCDFTSCNTAINLCHLSPDRINQCSVHRSGTACGSCENGYTLPFYSTECINEDNCTVLETVIVVVLTVVYWIALVIAVFITMYYKVSIGYLYAITYYYSMLDILLSEYLYIPHGLYITINIMYSIVKLTPQFLGKRCLVRGLSGIDQQFIHYVHPLAVSLMLLMIVVLARFSRRLSVFISRGIIRVICFLLLLSYTSVTFTSLHLVKYLKFSDVNKIYTYLSPDIEYFQGRHLVYGIIASLCIIFIVIGVPLILVIQPFLNHMINFVKIKPLLDQFQGCYKDKYRWFAGYYMICRIVIITITIIFSTSDFTSRYLLITICAAILLIHLSVRPYKSKLLNVFDGVLLLLLVLVSILLLAEFINSKSVVKITFALLTIPVIIFVAMYLSIHKDAIKKFVICSTINCKSKNMTSSDRESSAVTSHDFDLTIDDRMRVNATVCDV